MKTNNQPIFAGFRTLSDACEIVYRLQRDGIAAHIQSFYDRGETYSAWLGGWLTYPE